MVLGLGFSIRIELELQVLLSIALGGIRIERARKLEMIVECFQDLVKDRVQEPLSQCLEWLVRIECPRFAGPSRTCGQNHQEGPECKELHGGQCITRIEDSQAPACPLFS